MKWSHHRGFMSVETTVPERRTSTSTRMQCRQRIRFAHLLASTSMTIIDSPAAFHGTISCAGFMSSHRLPASVASAAPHRSVRRYCNRDNSDIEPVDVFKMEAVGPSLYTRTQVRLMQRVGFWWTSWMTSWVNWH